MKLTYDYVNPMTGRKTVLMEGDQMLCVETGYHTFKGWNESDLGHLTFEQNSPEEVVESKFVDNLGQFWFKITLFTDSVVLRPESNSNGWIVNQFRDLYIDELPGDKIQRIQKNVNGTEIVQVLDPLCEKHFSSFEEALNEFDKLRNNGTEE